MHGPGLSAPRPLPQEGYDGLPLGRGLLPESLQFFQLFELLVPDVFEFLDLSLWKEEGAFLGPQPPTWPAPQRRAHLGLLHLRRRASGA